MMNRTRRYTRWTALCVLLAWGGSAVGQFGAPPRGALGTPLGGATGTPLGGTPDSAYALKFDVAPLEMILNDYSQKTGRTVLAGPKVPKAQITLRSQGALTLEEYLQAVEAVLAMHGVGLVKVGEKFVKAVPIAEARNEAMAIRQTRFEPKRDARGQAVTNETGKVIQQVIPLDETDELVSQLIPLKHIDVASAKTAVEPLKHPYGTAHQFESINALLVTDTASNINRMVEVLQYIDQPAEIREEPHIIGVKHSKASDIKAMLEQIIAEAQADQRRTSSAVRKTAGSPGTVKRMAPPGVIRAPAPIPTAAETQEEIIAEAERGMIRGTVKIVADDRTNILIIITRPENMQFFEKIVRVLDVETAPDVVVRIFRLEFADSKEIASMLNELIGATSKADEPVASGAKAPVAEGSSAALREISAQPEPKAAAADGGGGKSKVGELSKDNIKILADERTNALIIMASKGDMAALEEIIGDMDIMLSQVLVEAVVLEVNLDDSYESGFDWLQRSLVAYNESSSGQRDPILSFAGTVGGGEALPLDALRFNDPSTFPTTSDGNPLGGLSYYLTFFDLNLDMVMRLVATDSKTRILSSPVILTTDNKDATIDVATERYFFKGKKYVGGGDNPFYEDDVETKKVGIQLSLTPRINEKKFVVMEITQQIDNVSGVQVINGTEWPIVTTRKLEADIAVRTGQTIVLGGLVQNSESRQNTKVPILGDIPILGIPFRSMRKRNNKTEVIVFITPYVMDTPEEIEADAVRRRRATSIDGMWKRGWSDSTLADPTREQIREARQAAKEAARHQHELEQKAAEARRERQDRDLEKLDPEVAEFIRIENARWDDALDEVDSRIEDDQ